MPSPLRLVINCVMMPFHGDKKRPRINVTTGETTFNWLFDTGAAITCMNANSFRQAFKNSKPKMITNGNGCVAANGSKMNSLGVYEIPMTIRGRKFVHPVTVVEDINDNIIGIDFMHINKLNYDTNSQQITFSHMLTNALYAVKETTIPALSSIVISSKFKGNICDTAKPIDQLPLYMPRKIQPFPVCQHGSLWINIKIAKWSSTIVHPMTLLSPETKFWVFSSSNQKSVSL